MDDMDQAQAADALFLDAALSGRRRRRTAGESPTHCIDCEEPIPEARRKAVPGCTRCVSCQETIETLEHWRN